MWTRRRACIALVALSTVALAAYFEPTHCVRGWLHGEAFYQGRPTSYWADEIQQWDHFISLGGMNGGVLVYQRSERSILPDFVSRFVPRREEPWPKLLDGDPEGLPVLEELLRHPVTDVRAWAQEGIARMHNNRRGPNKEY